MSISIETKKVDVDNRIPIRIYFRIADSLIRQANIYRNERNTIDLYVMLFRYSSLIQETLPNHRDYRLSCQKARNYYRNVLISALTELERIKPVVKKQLAEINQQNGFDDIYAWPPVKTQTPAQVNKVAGNGFVQRNNQQSLPYKSLFNIPPPREETLQRHSILGPNGLNGQWTPPVVNQAIQYPTSTLDLTPIDISSLLNPVEEKPKDENTPQQNNKKTPLEEVLSLDTSSSVETLAKLEIDKDPTANPAPPPVLAEVVDLGITGQVSDGDLQERLVKAQAPLQLIVSTALMDGFMRMAKSNTDRNLETCGILAGSLKNRKFYVTALIIPKQEATSDSCTTTNEEEVFDYQDKNSLFSLGWIHTHPTQSCFMSSIDIHTQYSYQVMLPEAIAIVMAPRDTSRKHGMFRLTVPGGMGVIKKCPHSGFHAHQSPTDGGPIYKSCTDVYMDAGLKFDVADLR
ncbi:hypothetical protein LUZ60_012722 [Juncus effusus]|nr:hypothetical protein LUZ60_012722 [Juncus effusus]